MPRHGVPIHEEQRHISNLVPLLYGGGRQLEAKWNHSWLLSPAVAQRVTAKLHALHVDIGVANCDHDGSGRQWTGPMEVSSNRRHEGGQEPTVPLFLSHQDIQLKQIGIFTNQLKILTNFIVCKLGIMLSKCHGKFSRNMNSEPKANNGSNQTSILKKFQNNIHSHIWTEIQIWFKIIFISKI